MQVLDVRWFCGRTNVGVVRVKFDAGDINYYIASILGDDEQEDIDYIASWGSYFPSDAGDVLFGVK